MIFLLFIISFEFMVMDYLGYTYFNILNFLDWFYLGLINMIVCIVILTAIDIFDDKPSHNYKISNDDDLRRL